MFKCYQVLFIQHFHPKIMALNKYATQTNTLLAAASNTDTWNIYNDSHVISYNLWHQFLLSIQMDFTTKGVTKELYC
jgi:hypothetical protein